MSTNPSPSARRGRTHDERIQLLGDAICMLGWTIKDRNLRVRGAVLLGLMNDRCDPIWKQLSKIVAKTDIDWARLAERAKCLIG